jgi:hypothetical protein
MDQTLIDKYNPDKFRELTQDDIEAMRQFTLADVADLAKAYPNKPTQRAYLVLFDKTDKARQLYPLSTWQNLYALWKQQLTKYIAFNFSALHNNKKTTGLQGAKTGPVQDLTQAEVTRAIKTVPKAKTSIPQTAKAQTATPVVNDNVDEDVNDHVDEEVHDDFDKMEKEAQSKANKTAPKKAATPVKSVKVAPKKK